MNALLLSAGLGTRFRPHTLTVAKPAIQFLGLPLMSYMLYYVEQLRVENLVFNTHHLPETVESAARSLTAGRKYKVHFSHEPEILGSGGGIRHAERFLRNGADSTFVVANADEFMLFNHSLGLGPLIDFHTKQGALATLLTTNHPLAGKQLGGVWVDEVAGRSGRITRLGGTHSQPGAQHFTGVFVFSDRIFDYMPRSGEFHIFKDCLHKAIDAHESVLAFHDADLFWLDMSSAEEHAAHTKFFEPLLHELEGSSEPDKFDRVLKKNMMFQGEQKLTALHLKNLMELRKYFQRSSSYTSG